MDPIQLHEIQGILNRKGIELVLSPTRPRMGNFCLCRKGWIFREGQAYIPGSMSTILDGYDDTNPWRQAKTAVLFIHERQHGHREVYLDLYTLYNKEV